MKFISAVLIVSFLFLFSNHIGIQSLDITVSADELADRPLPQKEEMVKHEISVKETTIYNKQIILKLKPGKNINYTKLGIKEKNTPPLVKERGIFVAEISNNEDLNAKLKELSKNPSFEYVEPNYLYKSYETANDPYLRDQWYLSSVNVLSAWGTLKNNFPVKVAVIDSGIESTHPDLAGKITNGYDFSSQSENQTDLLGHGTSVAGIIGAINNNNVGIAGINDQVQIIPVKISSGSTIPLVNVINGIYYAIAQGANIINMSYGSTAVNEAEYNALSEAYSKGITLIASAGNDGVNSVAYPAAYPFVIAVGSADQLGQKSSFSNFGNSLDLAAPGEGIVTTGLNGGYERVSGTSFSAPIVSGIASLLLRENPSLTPSEIEWLLENSTGKVWSQSLGFGLVNSYQALTTTLPDLKEDAGNSITEAKQIHFNTEFNEKIQLPDDIDWYKFQVSENQNLHIELNHVIDNDLALWIKKDGDTWEQSINDHGIGGNEAYSFNAAPGTYEIGVYDVNFHWSQNPYRLVVNNQPVQRIAGSSRIETAIEVSKKGWPDGLDNPERAVILARADNPADALSAAGLAGVKSSPILLTYPDNISQSTLDEIKRLQPSKIYILGGNAAINGSVENVLIGNGFNVQRISGKDRFETAAKINQSVGLANKEEAILVNGITVADALSASSVAATQKLPIYLATNNQIPVNLPSTVKKVYILGGTVAISSGLESSLQNNGVTVTRIAGQTRYETNIATLKNFLSPENIIIARGISVSPNYEDYPDAVAASGLAVRLNAAIVLANPLRSENVTNSYISDRALPAFILGGEVTLPKERLIEMGLSE